MKTVAVSGGFDPLHIGHLRMFEAARALGDRLVVILNNDNWLRSKKGFVFMPQSERLELIDKYPFVDDVILTEHEENDEDRSVCKILEELKPDIFANGGDRFNHNIPEYKLCEELGIEMVFGIGGGKVQSSGWLTDAVRRSGIMTERPWGRMTLYAHGPNYWIKTLTLKAGARTSLQKHEHRGELWMCIEGDVFTIIGSTRKEMAPFAATRFSAGTTHRLGSIHGGTIIEIGYGRCDEADIVRLEDDYKRT